MSNKLADENIPSWFKQLNLEGVVLKTPPPSYEFAISVKTSQVIFLIHKITHVVEIQYTNKFNDGIVDKFFAGDENFKNKIEYKLRCLLADKDIRYRVITAPKEKFFGFSLYIYLPKKPSDAAILDNYAKILEVRDLVGHYMSFLMSTVKRDHESE